MSFFRQGDQIMELPSRIGRTYTVHKQCLFKPSHLGWAYRWQLC